MEFFEEPNSNEKFMLGVKSYLTETEKTIKLPLNFRQIFFFGIGSHFFST